MVSQKKVTEINVMFAREVYKYFLKRRYGIKGCCGNDLDRAYTKKENCDLALRFIEGYCEDPVTPITPPVCP